MSVFDEKVTEESLVGMTLPNQGRNVDIFRGKMEYKKATMRQKIHFSYSIDKYGRTLIQKYGKVPYIILIAYAMILEEKSYIELGNKGLEL